MIRRMTVFSQVACITAAMAIAGPAAAETYLTFDGAPGARVSADSISFNVGRAAEYDAETGAMKSPAVYTTSSGPIYVSRSLDGVSPTIIDAVVNGKMAGDVELHVSEADASGTPTHEIVWMLKDGVFNNYSIYQAADAGTTESFDISYSEATINVFTLDPATGEASASPVSSVTWTPAADAMTMPAADH